MRRNQPSCSKSVYLGDVIIENDDIYGDGVNIAARLRKVSKLRSQ